MYADTRFWNVGHGGFFTESVHIDGSQFNYVYDCGTKHVKSILFEKVDKYVSDLVASNVSRIDLIVISHIDDDHINGLDYLLKKLKQNLIDIRDIFLPYLDDGLKICYLKRFKKSERWIREFIFNPQGYINRLTIEGTRIHFIQPTNEGDESEVFNDNLGFGPNKQYNGFQYKNKQGDICWNLSFFQKGLKQHLIDKFKLEVIKNEGSLDSKVILKKDVIGKVSKLRSYYKAILKNTNDTSLCLRSAFYPMSDSPNGLILTGDCPVGECWSIFYKKFELRKFVCCSYQLSHHGSVNSWKKVKGDKGLTSKDQLNINVCEYISYSNATKHHVSTPVRNLISRHRLIELKINSKNSFHVPPCNSIKFIIY